MFLKKIIILLFKGREMDKINDLLSYNDISSFDKNVDIALGNIAMYNDRFNAFCRVYYDDINVNRKRINDSILKNKHKKLAGMIVGLKDLFCYMNHPVQAASKILEGFVPSYDATVVRLISEEGVLIIGHQNCDEFGMGSSTTNSIYGESHNLLDYSRTTGGSSGGSSLAVQGNMCHISLATDTGGSVRQPASYCGVIGFKPSYGVISRFGVIEHASSFDTVGILGRHIDDISDVFSVISRSDSSDLSMSKHSCSDVENKVDYRVCVLKNTIELGCLQEEVKEGISSFLNKLGSSIILDEIVFDRIEYCSAVYFTLTTIEANSNLARYTGMNYGYRSMDYKSYDEMLINTRSEGFGFEVKKRLLLANYLFETNDVNKYIDKSISLRKYFIDRFVDIFSKYDFIVLPVTTTTAFKIGSHDSERSDWDDILTTLASITGYPAISIPCSCDKDGMPFGVQIIGNIYGDKKLFNFVKLLHNRNII